MIYAGFSQLQEKLLNNSLNEVINHPYNIVVKTRRQFKF